MVFMRDQRVIARWLLGVDSAEMLDRHSTVRAKDGVKLGNVRVAFPAV